MNALYAWIDAHPLPEVDLQKLATALELWLIAAWGVWMTIRVHGVWKAIDTTDYRGSHARPGRGNRKRTFGAASPTHDGMPNLQTVLSFARAPRPAYTPFPSYHTNYDRSAPAWM